MKSITCIEKKKMCLILVSIFLFIYLLLLSFKPENKNKHLCELIEVIFLFLTNYLRYIYIYIICQYNYYIKDQTV